MIALWTFLGASSLFLVGYKIAKRERLVWPSLAEAYGSSLSSEDSLTRLMWQLKGEIFDVSLELSYVVNRQRHDSNRLVFQCVAKGVPQSWSRSYYNKQISVAKLGKASPILNAKLSKRARLCIDSDNDEGAVLTDEAIDILVSSFAISSFKLQNSSVVSLHINEGEVRMKLRGNGADTAFLETSMANTAALARALQGRGMAGNPVQALRDSRLPRASLV